MKCLFIPEGESYAIELIAESQEERDTLVKYWTNDSFSVSCEEWRELSTEPQCP